MRPLRPGHMRGDWLRIFRTSLRSGMLSAVCCGGSGCVEFREARPAKSLSPSLSPDALELFSCPPSGGGIVHDGIGLPVKIPSGLRGCGGGIGSESGSVMPGKAELTLRSGVSGLGTPSASPNWSPKAGLWPGKYGVSSGAPCASGDAGSTDVIRLSKNNLPSTPPVPAIYGRDAGVAARVPCAEVGARPSGAADLLCVPSAGSAGEPFGGCGLAGLIAPPGLAQDGKAGNCKKLLRGIRRV